jgi:hypothetical protein
MATEAGKKVASEAIVLPAITWRQVGNGLTLRGDSENVCMGRWLRTEPQISQN